MDKETVENEVKGYGSVRPVEGRAIMGEVQGDTGQVGGGRRPAGEGLYRHPTAKKPDGTPAELITQHDELLGDGQSRAALRAGFEYVGPAPEGSIKTMGAPSDSQPAAAAPQTEELALLRERLAVLEAARDVPASQPAPAASQTASKPEGSVDDPTFAELQAEAKSLGLSAKGSKDELTQRVADARAAKGGES